MKHEFFLSMIFSMLIPTLMSCGGTSPANNSLNAGNSNSNLSSNNSAQQTTAKKNEEPTINDAPTLGPIVQKYYDSLKNKNDAELREVLTKDFIKRIEPDMKAAKQTNLAQFVATEDQYRPGQVVEVRNEKINGDKGEAELRGGAYRTWTAFSFAKEDGKWKFTGGSPEVENMPKSNANSPH